MENQARLNRTLGISSLLRAHTIPNHCFQTYKKKKEKNVKIKWISISQSVSQKIYTRCCFN